MNLQPLNCTLTPETTPGPYWVDTRLNRADIAEQQPGVPLRLELRVYEMDPACSPYEGAVVDVWHANALGLYSDEPDQPGGDTGGETFLRGYQVSGADGSARFETIYPSWYEGRTLHIHVRVRVFAEQEATFTFTTQMFFDEALNDAVLSCGPYDERPDRDTTNADDSIFLPELIAETDGDASRGYMAAFGIRLRDLPPPEARGTRP